ncbi:hypothetical protein, partial [Sulfitobacter sp. HI0023]|uniref:hypothetical protein n=1 Tax=Sulfitobacter sp. HI0023 TaxID=1822225 RepID=UPI001F44D3F5
HTSSFAGAFVCLHGSSTSHLQVSRKEHCVQVTKQLDLSIRYSEATPKKPHREISNYQCPFV